MRQNTEAHGQAERVAKRGSPVRVKVAAFLLALPMVASCGSVALTGRSTAAEHEQTMRLTRSEHRSALNPHEFGFSIEDSRTSREDLELLHREISREEFDRRAGGASGRPAQYLIEPPQTGQNVHYGDWSIAKAPLAYVFEPIIEAWNIPVSALVVANEDLLGDIYHVPVGRLASGGSGDIIVTDDVAGIAFRFFDFYRFTKIKFYLERGDLGQRTETRVVHDERSNSVRVFVIGMDEEGNATRGIEFSLDLATLNVEPIFYSFGE